MEVGQGAGVAWSGEEGVEGEGGVICRSIWSCPRLTRYLDCCLTASQMTALHSPGCYWT